MRALRGLWLFGLAAIVLAACSGGSGGQTASTTGPAGPATAGRTEPGGSAAGGGGSADSEGGSVSASLNTARFRTLEVTVTPTEGGTVSDNFGDYGSAVQDCVACRERYRVGTPVTLTAKSASGFRFEAWQGTACGGSPDPTCSVTIEDERPRHGPLREVTPPTAAA